jgi:hypothetical protein
MNYKCVQSPAQRAVAGAGRHSMKRILFPVLAGILIVSGIYLGLRSLATDQANKEIDAFFAELRNRKEGRWEDSSIALKQERAEIGSIVSRHEDALRNFSFETTTPELNWSLSETKIGVSWHLSITFSKRSGHWEPTCFNEFKPDPNKG